MIQSLYPCFQHWSRQGTVWVYSDPHFGDVERIAHFSRPTDEEQLAMINKKVGKKDTLIVLGDIGCLETAARMRGYKVLICGNHDAGGTIYRGVFDEIYTGPLFISDRLLLSHERINLPFAFNIHGHDHMRQDTDLMHMNVCSDVIGYQPVNLNQFFKSGRMARIPSIHRITINQATTRASRRPKRKD